MLELQERLTNFEQHLTMLADGNLGSRRQALSDFTSVGWPSSKDEEFRFTPLRDLAETPLSAPETAPFSKAEFDALPIAKVDGPRLVFVNGFFSAELSDLAAESGLSIEVLEGSDSRLGLIATYEGKLGSTNDPRFIRLNDALHSSVAYVHVSTSKVIEKPIQITYVVTDSSTPTAIHPRVFIHLERNAQATLIETYVGMHGLYFTNAVTEVRLEEDALLEHNRVQKESSQAFHIAHLWAHQEGGSTFTSNSVQFGAKVGRIDVNVWINGEHTETSLNGTYVGKGQQVLDNKTRIDHAKPNCHSFEVYKGILDEQSHGVFNGKIFVYEDAQKTDAKQTNQALLLSNEATINTKPQLEIFADDVKCTHGATIGQLRDDQRFYLQSRGISGQEARNMLVYAFAAEVLEKIGVGPLKDYLEEELYRKLNR